MNLRKRLPASDNEKKVVDPLLHNHLKPEKVKRKRSLKLLSKSFDKNPGWCIKKSATGWDEVAKPLDDNDRKMQFSEAMDSIFELQGFSESSGVRLKEINKGSCTTKKAVNPSFKKYPKHLRLEGASFLNEDLIKSVKWPASLRKFGPSWKESKRRKTKIRNIVYSLLTRRSCRRNSIKAASKIISTI